MLLGAREASERVKVAGCLGAVYTPHGAAVDPARLARGLAEVVERLRRADLRAHPRDRDRPARRRDALRHREGRGRRARHRGVHARAPRPRERRGADLLADDRHRAALRRDLGGARLEGARGLRRPASPHLLRLPHRRRPHRHRGPRGALPLRVEAERRVHAQPQGPGPPPRADPRRSSRRSAPSASPTAGAGRSRRAATGTRRSASSARPATPGPAPTSATASRRRTSPAARCAT